jgi:predicted RNase H-like HicB family nuclease
MTTSTSPQYLLLRIDANLPWKYKIGNGGHYVAVCDPLKLTLQAETWADLMEDTADVLNSIFNDLLSSNELDRFLHHHGWRLRGPVPVQQENVRFDVPFFFSPEMAQQNGTQNYLPQ